MDKDIYNSKGQLHNSCPYINNIIELCNEQEKIIAKIKEELERVRRINEELRNHQEMWDDISFVTGIKRCNLGDLEKLAREKQALENKIEKLKEENDDLLRKLEGFDYA